VERSMFRRSADGRVRHCNQHASYTTFECNKLFSRASDSGCIRTNPLNKNKTIFHRHVNYVQLQCVVSAIFPRCVANSLATSQTLLETRWSSLQGALLRVKVIKGATFSVSQNIPRGSECMAVYCEYSIRDFLRKILGTRYGPVGTRFLWF